ncbi:hypothetical protein [Cellulomonas pakistanensis]|uniref:Uncharacterized protein n=1 Tax=Cellulomonas pakistanensis TaxID=992287 RepID=A0A919P9U7_9CELL|nr:hypothetical protein [Cellulomonas pakistanensis]GIG36283.1 hypothetical protein Cpa01nite_16640 [Cellulomonas pakistanensis]
MTNLPNLPHGSSIPDGTIALTDSNGNFVMIRRCDVCFAAVIEAHDADYQEHIEWHERTDTNIPPTA